MCFSAGFFFFCELPATGVSTVITTLHRKKKKKQLRKAVAPGGSHPRLRSPSSAAHPSRLPQRAVRVIWESLCAHTHTECVGRSYVPLRYFSFAFFLIFIVVFTRSRVVVEGHFNRVAALALFRSRLPAFARKAVASLSNLFSREIHAAVGLDRKGEEL